MTAVTIDIVSDIACPWCAIGFARLEQALQQLQGEVEARIEWHPFELNPDQAGDGEPVEEALIRKYGRSREEIQAIQTQILDIAQGQGLNFAALRQRDVRNTFDGHRLVKWAASQGKATEMKKALFEAYFGHNARITDAEVLAGYAEAAGLDKAKALQLLASDQYADAVRQDEQQWQQAGISSVPAFIINQQYLISGAQEPATLVSALREIASKTPAN